MKKKTQRRPLRSLSSKLQHQRQKILPEASAESNTANITFTLLFGSWKMLFFGFVFFFLVGKIKNKLKKKKKIRHTQTIKSVSKCPPVVRKNSFSLFISQHARGRLDAAHFSFPTKDSEMVTNCPQFIQFLLSRAAFDPFSSPEPAIFTARNP